MGRRRWFHHKRGGLDALNVDQYDDASFLQKRFIEVAADVYGYDESDMPRDARKHL
jgi:hypothetical protein